MIRIVIAEDSLATREYLIHILDGDAALEVVGAGSAGDEAIDLVDALRPDVVVMDIHMPRVDGYEATRRIMERIPTPIVMISAPASEFETKAFESLRAGALVLVEKPEGPLHPSAHASVRRLVNTVKLMAEVKVVRRWSGGEPPQRPRSLPAPRPIRVIAIGASAGGPPVVADILGRVPRRLPCPILVVQHIAPGFASGLAEWLGRVSGLATKLAEADERTRAATVYLAPDGVQMGIDTGGRIVLAPDEPEADGFRPSASYLLSSVARSHGRSAMGILLTGMGRDGARGLLELRERGGVTIAQDKESSVVFGMPGEAIRLGAAEHVLPPARIAEAIATLTMTPVGADRATE